MKRYRIYPQDLIEFIKEFPYIPKKLKYVDEIKRYAKYYCLDLKIGFKVEEVIEVSGQIYYQIRLLDTGRQAVIPYEEKFTYYELLTDKNDLKTLAIINSDSPFFGSEIKYWFFINNINLHSICYQGFAPLVTESDKTLSDRKIYFLKGLYLPDSKIYMNCRAELCKQ